MCVHDIYIYSSFERKFESDASLAKNVTKGDGWQTDVLLEFIVEGCILNIEARYVYEILIKVMRHKIPHDSRQLITNR